MKTAKKVKIGVVVLFVLLIALFLHYNLPRTAVVKISGTDIKRMDSSSGKMVTQQTAGQSEVKGRVTYDVRFINAISRSGKTMVFRNEDTGWGWPPYFKFDSADVTAQAQSFATKPETPWVLVKYYGWRFRIFSTFPNAISLKAVDENYSHLPLFNIIFIVLLIAAVLFIRYKLRSFFQRFRSKKGAVEGADKNS